VASEETFRLDGGTLYIFTDGVTEGDLKDGSQLGTEGFKKIIREHIDLPVDERIAIIVSALGDTGRKRHDDITLIAIDATSPCLNEATQHNQATMVARHTFPARADELQAVREVVSKACDDCGCTRSMATDLVIATCLQGHRRWQGNIGNIL
jgi:sigma-B regulation protein RsbU (phosphoserine phosphatase)